MNAALNRRGSQQADTIDTTTTEPVIAPDEPWQLPPPVRQRPLSEKEIEQITRLCRQSIPGPFVVGDAADGEDRLLAMLADGRPLVSRGLAMGEPLEPEVIEATLQLFCRARHLLLHLLAERESLKQRCNSLQQRCDELAEEVHELSAQVDQRTQWRPSETETVPREGGGPRLTGAPRRPR